MKLTKVLLVHNVAPPSQRDRMPRNSLYTQYQPAQQVGLAGCVESLELRDDVVVVDGTRAIPLSNVAWYEPPREKRGRPSKVE